MKYHIITLGCPKNNVDSEGMAGILAWPGRYCRKLGKELPIATARREDGGTDYWMDEATAALFRRGDEVAAAPPEA